MRPLPRRPRAPYAPGRAFPAAPPAAQLPRPGLGPGLGTEAVRRSGQGSLPRGRAPARDGAAARCRQGRIPAAESEPLNLSLFKSRVKLFDSVSVAAPAQRSDGGGFHSPGRRTDSGPQQRDVTDRVTGH